MVDAKGYAHPSDYISVYDFYSFTPSTITFKSLLKPLISFAEAAIFITLLF